MKNLYKNIFCVVLFWTIVPNCFSQNLEVKETDTYLRGLVEKKSGKVVIPVIYHQVDLSSEGVITVCDTLMNWGTFDEKGKTLMAFTAKYKYLGKSNDGLLLARDQNDRHGYLDKNGKIAIPFVYDQTHNFINGKALVKLNEKYYRIDTQGKIIEEAKPGQLSWQEMFPIITLPFPRIYIHKY